MTQSVKPEVQTTLSTQRYLKEEKYAKLCVQNDLHVEHKNTPSLCNSFILESFMQFSFCISPKGSLVIPAYFKVTKLLMCLCVRVCMHELSLK